jgi:hypothetical protein
MPEKISGFISISSHVLGADIKAIAGWIINSHHVISLGILGLTRNCLLLSRDRFRIV